MASTELIDIIDEALANNPEGTLEYLLRPMQLLRAAENGENTAPD